jgi:hypothetical protein
MAAVERAYIHEGDADVVDPYESTGYLAVDDAGEDRGHEAIVGCR